MFSVDNTNKISIIQGDTGALNLSLDNYELGEGDIVYLAVVDKVVNPVTREATIEPVIKKKITHFTNGNANFLFDKEDTMNLTPKIYSYDIQVNAKDGRIDTVVPASKFVVGEGISNEY